MTDLTAFGMVPVEGGQPPQATGEASSLADFGMAPTGAVAPAPAPPSHNVAGPSDSLLTDIPRRLGSAIINAGVGLVSPLVGKGGVGVNYDAGLHPTGVTYQPPLPQADVPAAQQEAKSNAFNALGATEYKPETLAGRMTQAALSGGVLAAANPASIPTMMGGSATGEAAAEAFPNHPEVAALLGFIPGAAATKAMGNLALPAAGGALDAGTAALAKSARDYGIPLSLTQVGSNPFFKYLYSEGAKLPLSGAQNFQDQQLGAWTKAVSNQMGENAEKITPEVMQSAKTRLSDGFNEVATKISAPVDGQTLTDLQDAINNARMTMSADSVAPVEKQAMNIIDTAANNGGNIGGRAYIDLTAKGGPLDQMMHSNDSGLRFAGTKLRGALDDALQRNAAPEDLKTLMDLRAQWKAMRTIEPLTLRGDSAQGVTPSTGVISPAALRGAVNKAYKNSAFASLGDIPLNDLAKIGQRFLKEPGDSQTATRSAAQHAIQGVGGLAGIMTAHEMGVPLATAAAGTAGTLAANRAAQSLMRAQPIANRMISASMNPNGFQLTYPMIGQIPAATLPAFPFGAPPPSSGNSGQR